MKHIIQLFFALFLTSSLMGQTHEAMSFQAVVRNANNQILDNATVGMQISIIQSSANGPAVYVERQTPQTNDNGLVSIAIGGGTPITGAFGDIDWSVGPYFIKTETDPSGGTDYTISGTSQLLSVPYALYAENAKIPSRKHSIIITPSMLNSSWQTEGVNFSYIGGWVHTAMEFPDGERNSVTISVPIPDNYNGGTFTAKALYSSTTDNGNFDCNIFARGVAIDTNIEQGTGGGGLLLNPPTASNHLASQRTQLATIDGTKEIVNINFTRRGDSADDTSTGSLLLVGIVLEYWD